MAARTTTKSGNASDATVWDGGTALAENDSITIVAGHTLTWDMDKVPTWTTNGVAGIIISGHATTPAKLTFPSANGTYTLPLKAATTISGTNLAALGQFHIGSAGSPPAAGVYIKVEFLGTTTGTRVDGTYLDIQLFCTRPTNRWVRATGAEAISSTVIEVDTDVSADWAANDTIAYFDTKATEWERYTIQSIAAGAITLTSGLTVAKNAGAFLVKVNRNVEFIQNLAAAGTDVGSVFRPCNHGTTIDIACRQTLGNTNANVTGSLMRSCTGTTFAGVACGYNHGFNSSTRCEVSGIFAGITNGSFSSDYFNSGTVISGALFACALAGYCRITSTGLVACRAIGMSDVDFAGTVIGMGAGMSGYCILRQGSVIGGSGNDANTMDVWNGTGLYRSVIVGYGTSLRSATQVSGYLTHSDFPLGTVTLYDVADAGGTPQPGQLAWWCGGGYGKSEAWVVGTHGTPPVTLVYVHKSTFESALGRNFVDIPILCEAGRPVRILVYAKKQQNGMTQTPKAQLIDPNKPWGDANEAVAGATMADNTNWQTLSLKYDNTTAAPKQLALRVWGTNATGSLYWNWAIRQGARRQQPIHQGV